MCLGISLQVKLTRNRPRPLKYTTDMPSISQLRSIKQHQFLEMPTKYPAPSTGGKKYIRVKAGRKPLENEKDVDKFHTLDMDRCRAEIGYPQREIHEVLFRSCNYKYMHILKDVPDKILKAAFDHFVNYINKGFYISRNNQECSRLHGNPEDSKQLMNACTTLDLRNDASSESIKLHEQSWRDEAEEHAYVYTLAIKMDCYGLQVMALEELKLCLERQCKHIVISDKEVFIRHRPWPAHHESVELESFNVSVDIIFQIAKVLCGGVPEDTKSDLARRTGESATDFVAHTVASRYGEMRKFPRFLRFLTQEGWNFKKRVVVFMSGRTRQLLTSDLKMFQQLMENEGHRPEKLRGLLRDDIYEGYIKEKIWIEQEGVRRGNVRSTEDPKEQSEKGSPKKLEHCEQYQNERLSHLSEQRRASKKSTIPETPQRSTAGSSKTPKDSRSDSRGDPLEDSSETSNSVSVKSPRISRHHNTPFYSLLSVRI